MVALIPNSPKLVVPSSSSLIQGAEATPELMAFLNEVARLSNKIAAAEATVVDDITPDQLASDFGTVILGWETTVDATIRSTSATIPLDNTKPQISEGAEAFSLSYTPKRSDSKLFIEATFYATATGLTQQCALFMSSQNDCLASCVPASNYQVLRAEVDSWGTTSRTFSVRQGGTSGGNTNYIGSYRTGTATHDNAMLSVLTVIERKATPISA